MKKLALTSGLVAMTLTPAVVLGGELPAQESLQGMQFNISPPGARSLGMGGAFLGRADDATAAYANPAGLTNLFSMEISVEGRYNQFDTPYVNGGDFPNDLNTETEDSSNTNLSFASFALPLNENWVLAAYGQQFMDFDSAFEAGSIRVPVISPPGGPTSLALFATNNSTDIDITNYGLSLGWRLAESFSLGFGVSYYDFSMRASTERIAQEGVAPPGFAPGEVINQQLSTGSDDDIGFNIGGLWKMTDTLSLGLVYRSAPEFNGTHMFIDNNPVGADPFMRSFSFEAPDIYGVGLSWQPTDRWTIGLDVNRVNYSNLTSDMISPNNLVPDAGEAEILSNLGIDDGTEVRLGVEYVFADMNNPLALRAGIWNDPAHFLESNNTVDLNDLDISGDPDVFAQAVLASVYESLYRGGDDEIHYSFGLGMSFENFQIDAAADFSDIQNIVSVSGVFFFR